MDQAFQTKRAVKALNRFGLGVRPEGASVMGDDPQKALLADIKAPVLFGDLPTTGQLLVALEEYQEAREAERTQKKLSDMQKKAAAERDAGKNIIQETINEETKARLDYWHKTPIGFYERLVMFWANHFAISIEKSNAVRILAGAYEREAIRPYILGSFENLLLAAESHPAMLIYLDNDKSIGPNSLAANNVRARTGLNENLAREILELHTLGVHGGYSQQDVTALARILTGWGVDRTGENPRGFRYNVNTHEPGKHTFLGKSYPNDGVKQGIDALTFLARAPQTAAHIATKLVRHFISDHPSQSLIDKVAKRFKDTGGNLKEVYSALLDTDEAMYTPDTKVRSPQEYVIAVMRGLNFSYNPPKFNQVLRALGQGLWQPTGPNGYSDHSEIWASPEGLSNRLDYIYELCEQRAQFYDPRQFAEQILPALLSENTKKAVALAETRAQGMAIAFLSPEFMRR